MRAESEAWARWDSSTAPFKGCWHWCKGGPEGEGLRPVCHVTPMSDPVDVTDSIPDGPDICRVCFKKAP